MQLLIQTLVNGLVLSSIYILVALGFALIFSVMQVLNFSHGSIYMVGAYVTYFAGSILGLPPWAAVAASALVLALFGVFLERCGFRILAKDFNRTLMFSLAIIVLLQTAADVTVGGVLRHVPSILPGLTRVGSVTLSKERVIACVIAVCLLLAVNLLIRKTGLGREMRAVSLDRTASALQGINVHRVSAFAFAVSCALASVAGGLMGSISRVDSYMGDAMLVKALALVIIAGMGSIGGLFVSGLIVGFMDATLPIYFGAAGGEVAATAFAILILVIRPQGLFGQEV